MQKKVERIREKLAKEQGPSTRDEPKRMESALRQLHEGSYKSVVLCKGYWESSFSHGLKVDEEIAHHRASVQKDCLHHATLQLSRAGYCICPEVDWGEGISMQKMVQAMEELKGKGWPACFVFAYRQPWVLIERLFDIVAPIFGVCARRVCVCVCVCVCAFGS